MTGLPTLNPILRHRVDYDSDPFSGDLLQRSAIATALTEYVIRLRAGAVICVDAPWGEGKTWFARNWTAKLEKDAYSVVFIDAFAHDYSEDPFMVLASSLIRVIPKTDSSKDKLRRQAVVLAKEMLPLSLRVSARLAERFFLGGAVISDAAEDVPQKLRKAKNTTIDNLLAERLGSTPQTSKLIDEFRTCLSLLVKQNERPIVFVVDELDRCKPDFAIRLIECAKHLFDVPGVVFVLFANRSSIEDAVSGTYGLTKDATGYLDKYIELFLALPRHAQQSGRFGFAEMFIKGVLKRYEFPSGYGEADLATELAFWSDPLDLSLRDLERAVALFVLSGRKGNTSVILAYLIALKLKHPNLFAGILNDQPEAFEASVKLLKECFGRLKGHRWQHPGANFYEAVLVNLHLLRLGEIGDFQRTDAAGYMQQWPMLDARDALRYFAKTVDLSVG